jgi:hypothetical protein
MFGRVVHQRLLEQFTHKIQIMITEIQSKNHRKSRPLKIEHGTVAKATKGVYVVVNMATWAGLRIDLKFLDRLAASVPASNLIATVYPESVLPHARRYAAQCDTVINLDRVAGLGGGEELLFEDGQQDFRRFEFSSETWGDYIDFDRKKEFVWGHPSNECSLSTQCRADVYNDPTDVPFERITQRLDGAWKQLKHYIARPPHYGVSLSGVRAAAFVLAPGRCSPSAVAPFLSFVKSNGLRILDWSQGYLSERWLLAECERQ